MVDNFCWDWRMIAILKYCPHLTSKPVTAFVICWKHPWSTLTISVGHDSCLFFFPLKIVLLISSDELEGTVCSLLHNVVILVLFSIASLWHHKQGRPALAQGSSVSAGKGQSEATVPHELHRWRAALLWNIASLDSRADNNIRTIVVSGYLKSVVAIYEGCWSRNWERNTYVSSFVLLHSEC